MHYHKGWVNDCENPCSIASHGITTYTYENMDLRMLPGIQRGTKKWHDTYKIRTIVERQSFQNQYVHRWKKNSKSYHHQSRCFSGRHCQPADCHRCACNGLCTIHSKSKNFNCLKKKYSIVINLISACISTRKI